MPNGYPNPTRYPVFSSIPDPTRFNFENHRVAGNPKYRVLPDISGKPEHQLYPKYPRVNKVPRPKIPNHKISTPLPICYPTVFFQFLAQTCPILKNSNYWALFLPTYYISNTHDKSKNGYFRYICSQHRQYSCLTNVPKWSFEEYMHPLNSNSLSIYLCKSRRPGLFDLNKTDSMCV